MEEKKIKEFKKFIENFKKKYNANDEEIFEIIVEQLGIGLDGWYFIN